MIMQVYIAIKQVKSGMYVIYVSAYNILGYRADSNIIQNMHLTMSIEFSPVLKMRDLWL